MFQHAHALGNILLKKNKCEHSRRVIHQPYGVGRARVPPRRRQPLLRAPHLPAPHLRRQRLPPAGVRFFLLVFFLNFFSRTPTSVGGAPRAAHSRASLSLPPSLPPSLFLSLSLSLSLTEKVHARARKAPSRKTRRVAAADEVWSRVTPRNGGYHFFYSLERQFLTGTYS